MKYFAENDTEDYHNYEGSFFNTLREAKRWIARCRQTSPFTIYKLTKVK